MGISIAHQTTVFLYSALFGVACALLYDVFRAIRRKIRHTNLLVMLEDIIYWILAASALFVFVYNVNFGELRAFLFIGAIFGAFLYSVTIGSVMMRALTLLIELSARAAKTSLAPFIRGFTSFYRISKNSAKKSGDRVRNLKKHFQFRIKSVILSAGIKKCSKEKPRQK